MRFKLDQNPELKLPQKSSTPFKLAYSYSYILYCRGHVMNPTRLAAMKEGLLQEMDGIGAQLQGCFSNFKLNCFSRNLQPLPCRCDNALYLGAAHSPRDDGPKYRTGGE